MKFMFCRNCVGTTIHDNDKCCSKCGKKNKEVSK